MEAWTNLCRERRRLGRGGWAAGVLAVVLLTGVPAASAQLPRVAVTLAPTCTQLDESALRRVLDVEVGALVELSGDVEGASAVIAVSCEGELARLALTDVGTETPHHLEREIDLSGMRGPSRLVAMAIAELLAASWIRSPPSPPAEPTDAPPSEPTPSEPPPSEPTPSELPPEPSAVDVAAGATEPVPSAVAETPAAPSTGRGSAFGARVFALLGVSGDPLHGWGGGGLGLDVLLADPLVLRADLRASHGTLDAVGLGGVTDTRASGAALLALRVGMDAGHLDVGAGVRLGVGVLEGQGADDDGRTLAGPLLEPVLAAELSVAIAAPLHLHVGVEAGWNVLGVAGTDGATGSTVARIGGPEAALALGLEVRP